MGGKWCMSQHMCMSQFLLCHVQTVAYTAAREVLVKGWSTTKTCTRFSYLMLQ